MPAQVQKSTLAQRMGAQIAQAHEQTKDKPVDTGFQRLPAGIKNGGAELRFCGVQAYQPGQKSYENHKGEEYFRAMGVAIYPEEHGGIPVAGGQTSVMIPLHSTPATATGRKEVTFLENYTEFQNWFKMFGIQPPNVSNVPQAQRGTVIMDYYIAQCAVLMAKTPKPQFKFSTRGWTPKPTKDKPKPDEMVFETWHGMLEHPHVINAAANGIADPGAPESGHPAAHDPTMAPEPFNEFSPNGDTTAADGGSMDPTAVIEALVAQCEGDPNGDTPDGATAISQLKQAAFDAGFTEAQVDTAANWAEVGGMALGILPESANAAAPAAKTPTVGSKWKYLRRAGGTVLLNQTTKQPFPHIDIELLTVDAAAKTCTAKNLADGKTISGIGKGAGPVQIKYEWLE